jgi:flagellum-specific peptidoglycan hydrolase FlgJ
MKASKNQDGTVVTTHEGHGSGRVKIKDRFLNYSSVNDSINQAVRRLNDKFNAFSVPTNQFVMNLYQNRYYTNSPANYEDVVSGIVNGKLIKKVLKETTLPK